MILTVYLSDGEQAVAEVPITPETTCRDVVEFCKEPGESGCHLAEVWRGNGKTCRKAFLHLLMCIQMPKTRRQKVLNFFWAGAEQWGSIILPLFSLSASISWAGYCLSCTVTFYRTIFNVWNCSIIKGFLKLSSCGLKKRKRKTQMTWLLSKSKVREGLHAGALHSTVTTDSTRAQPHHCTDTPGAISIFIFHRGPALLFTGTVLMMQPAAQKKLCFWLFPRSSLHKRTRKAQTNAGLFRWLMPTNRWFHSALLKGMGS